MNNQSKVIVVTGASQGIGAEVVKAFRELGYRIVATSRSIKPVDDEDILTVAGDIGERETAERVIAEGLARFGRIDTLVNNAGNFISKPFTEHSVDDYSAAMHVNMRGFFNITQLAIAEMEKRGSGHVVTLTTSIDQVAISGTHTVLAAMTKGGLNAATKSLAIEYAKKGIRVNAVAPGAIRTPMYAPADYQALSALQPIGRMGEPGEIASAILFLDRSPFITGEILHVDGGQSAGH